MVVWQDAYPTRPQVMHMVNMPPPMVCTDYTGHYPAFLPVGWFYAIFKMPLLGIGLALRIFNNSMDIAYLVLTYVYSIYIIHVLTFSGSCIHPL